MTASPAGSDVPLPEVTPANRPYWEGAREGRLMIQRCPDCGTPNFPPRLACTECFADLEWVEAEGRGTVFTYGVVHRPNLPDVFGGAAPFVVAVVELAEGPLVLSNVVECEPAEVEVGAAVEAVFEPLDDGTGLPLFALA